MCTCACECLLVSLLDVLSFFVLACGPACSSLSPVSSCCSLCPVGSWSLGSLRFWVLGFPLHYSPVWVPPHLTPHSLFPHGMVGNTFYHQRSSVILAQITALFGTLLNWRARQAMRKVGSVVCVAAERQLPNPNPAGLQVHFGASGRGAALAPLGLNARLFACLPCFILLAVLPDSCLLACPLACLLLLAWLPACAPACSPPCNWQLYTKGNVEDTARHYPRV